MVVCDARERLLSASFIGTALACKTARLLRSNTNVYSPDRRWSFVVLENVCFQSRLSVLPLLARRRVSRSLVSRHERKKSKWMWTVITNESIMDFDDNDLNKLLTGDGRLWYTRTFAFSLVYRYRSCLQDGASPAEWHNETIMGLDITKLSWNLTITKLSWNFDIETIMELHDYDDLHRFLTGDGRCGTRERLLSASFIGTALACKTARLLRSLKWPMPV